MYNFNRANVRVSAQVSYIAALDISSANFTSDTPFQIKNDGPDPVTLEVTLWSMPEGTFVATVFDPGWNPEIVRTVKANANVSNLKYGY